MGLKTVGFTFSINSCGRLFFVFFLSIAMHKPMTRRALNRFVVVVGRLGPSRCYGPEQKIHRTFISQHQFLTSASAPIAPPSLSLGPWRRSLAAKADESSEKAQERKDEKSDETKEEENVKKD